MACGHCGGSGKNVGTAATLRRSDVTPTAGLYLTVSNDDCSGPYHGDSGAKKVWVVGIGTEQEEIFPDSRRGDAIAKARSGELSIDSLPVSQLCHEAVLAAVGS